MGTVRRTRREAQEANRAALLAAARELFEELGYHRATLDTIAARAGFSKGVVYSQFSSKDDLFLAVLEANIARRDADLRDQLLADEGAVIERVAGASVTESAQSLRWQAALIEFRVHAWRHPEVNRRYAELHRSTIAKLTALVEEASELDAGVTAPTTQDLVRAFATTNGLMLELMADPALDIAAIADDEARATTRGRKPA